MIHSYDELMAKPDKTEEEDMLLVAIDKIYDEIDMRKDIIYEKLWEEVNENLE